MGLEQDQTLEVVGKDAWARLQLCHARFSPSYGPEVAQSIFNFMLNKLSVSAERRADWLRAELGLATATKGLINYDGDPRSVTSEVLSVARNYGAEDFVIIIDAAVTDMREKSISIPDKLLSDLELTRAWVGALQAKQ